MPDYGYTYEQAMALHEKMKAFEKYIECDEWRHRHPIQIDAWVDVDEHQDNGMIVARPSPRRYVRIGDGQRQRTFIFSPDQYNEFSKKLKDSGLLGRLRKQRA